MSKSTISISFKLDGQDKTFDVLKKEADGFREAIEATLNPLQRLKRDVLDLNQVSQSINTLASSFNGIVSQLGLLTAEAQKDIESETKLAQAMRNTMSATDDEIESVKKLCDAQERVGVVSADVQMSGAQELATYLEMSDNLKRLIPVMNDMIAQQIGIGASAESAAGIASMLGKVMNGQTEALSRYGYKFDEAQKQILKFGTESERAAVLAEVVEQSVSGMNEALGKTDAGKAEQWRAFIGGLASDAGRLIQRLEPTLVAFGSLVNTVAAIGQMGTGLKAMQKALAGLGITRLATSITAANRAAVSFAANGLKMTTSNARALITAFGSARRATVALRAAMGGLAALAAGALALALSKIISRHREQKEAADAAAQSYRDSFSAVESARSELQSTIAAIKAFNGTSDEQKALIDQLNTRWGDTFGTFTTLSDWYDVLSKKIDTYCQKLALQTELEQINARIGDSILRKRQLEENASTLPDAVTQTIAGPGTSYSTSVPNLKKLGLLDEASSLGEGIEADKRRLSELLSELAGIDASLKAPLEGTKTAVSSVSDSAKTLADDIAALRRSVKADIEVNRTFNGGLNEQDVIIRSMESGITALIRKYGLENEAVQGLVAEYGALLRSRQSIDGALPVLPGITAPATTGDGGLKGDRDITPVIKVDKVNAATEALGALSSTMGSLASAVGEGAAQWLNWLGSLLTAVGQALPQIAALVAARKAEATANAEAAVTGAAASVAGVPGVGAIMAAASVASVLAAIASVPKFASGGIVSGPTLALVGEYPGAAHNPEVIAPVDKLSGLIGRSVGTGEVHFRIEGRDLVGVLNRVGNLDRRS